MEIFLIFVTVTLGMLAVIYSLTDAGVSDRARIRKRLLEELRQVPSNPESAALFKDMKSLTLPPASDHSLPALEPPLKRWLVAAKTGLLDNLDRSGWTWGTPAFLGVVIAVGSIAGLAGWWLLGVYGMIAGIVAAVAGVLVALRAIVTQKRERFLKQLPGAFELMSRVIKAGQSVPQALVAITESFEDPLASEFGRCLHQQNLGVRPEVVFRDMAERSRILELRIFVMAMTIQRTSGGNLAEMLERLATMIRGRLRIRQQVRTLTAEGRLQGLTLTALPVILFAVMLIINRPYAVILFDHAWLLWLTGGLMLVGTLWIRRIVNFDV